MKTQFVFTIDVESRTDGHPKSDILGILPGHDENLGVTKIMDLLETGQARGTFFLNVYESAKYGEEAIASIARSIHGRGHDLELHTHPRPMYPYYGMADAGLEDQVAIIRKGILLLQTWAGKTPVAHRAGAFRANMDTVRAAEICGLLAECSLSPGSKVVVPLNQEFGASNRPVRVGKVWEIPATHYIQLRLGNWCSRRILDIEGSSLSEIKQVTRFAIRDGLPTVCILLHSFSLSRSGNPNRRVIHRLSSLLKWLRDEEGIEVCTIEQTCQHLNSDAITQSANRVPYTGFALTWNRALLGWRDGWKNLAVAAGGLIFIATLLLALAYLGLRVLAY